MATTMEAKPPPPPQWVLDLKSQPATKLKPGTVADPPGFASASKPQRSLTKQQQQQQQQQNAAATKPSTTTPEEMDQLKVKKAWEVALAPAKSLPMNAVMMYMSGNSLQIFSIMMVFMLFKGPVQSLLQTRQAFARFESDGTRSQLLLVKMAYVVMNLVALSLGIWKVNGMGLLPTTRSDWLAWEAERVPLEKTIYAFK